MKKPKRNQNIAQKISKSIISITILCSLIIGLIGIVGIAVINFQSKQIYDENLTPLSPVYTVQADFQSIRNDLKSMALEEATKTKSGKDYTNEINNYQNDIAAKLNTYAKNISSDNERKNYNSIVADIEKYKATVNGIESSVQSDDIIQAVKTMNENNSLSTDLKNRISNAFTLNTDQARQTNDTATILFCLAIFLVLACAAVIILAASRVCKRVAASISDPINKMVEAAESIAKGNLNIDIDVSTGDETEILAASFKKIVSALQHMEKDVNMLIKEALNGKLDTRADTSLHEGDYREIIDGVNKMLDTVKEPLDVASGFINRLADGEHQDEIENTYKGYYATLIDNLNKVRDSVNVLEAESAKLAQAGLDGDLDIRGDESKLKGVYAQIIHGVNATFDSIKAPLDVASGFINRLADGEAQNEIENTYKGYYATLIDNLNNVLNSLHILMDESDKLAAAGGKGDLTVRGDLTKLKGGYAQIIGGFNRTLESIVVPLEESKTVLGKMAVNDYTTSVTGHYNGMLDEFSKSVNQVMDTLKKIENLFLMIAKGDLSSYEEYKKIGKISSNDKMMPAAVSMMQAIKDLISESDMLASAAAVGDLGQKGDETKFEGGYRRIIEGVNNTISSVVSPIKEASSVLKELAKGDLTVEMTGDYQGEYNQIKTDLNSAVRSFREVLTQINIAARQVTVGSKQVSDASQSLSQGATEQASSIEELTSSIAEIASQTKQNAVNATQASTLSAEAQGEASQGNEKMGQMLSSMKEINESSASISKIVKVIDDIAFQTNILALNAAVEAARAGQYGKGFAVVAEEVRNLASKSANAVKDTSALIEVSITKAENGTKIASETAKTLEKISDSIKKSADLVGSIATASNEQATAISQVDQGISQVSTVVQTNSATAEESAASSEELNGQAITLMEMVGRFKLNRTDAAAQ